MVLRAALFSSALLTLVACSTGAVERCELHERREGTECVAHCDEGERLLSNLRCEPICDIGEEPVGDECLPACPDGEEYVEDDCVPLCAADEQRVDGRCRGPSAVRVNSVGYPNDAVKLAVISDEPGAIEVLDEDGNLALSVEASGPSHDAVTGLDLWTADFSALTTPGRYALHVEGVGESAPFNVSANPFASTLELAMLGFYGLRCGTEVHFETSSEAFAHEECHSEDAVEAVGSSSRIESVGGWHDAGDYGKYTQNAAFTVGMLLLAWEHFGTQLEALSVTELPEQGGALPDFLDEVKWELSWLLTLQLADGSTYHKLTAQNFEGFIMPENDSSPRYMAPPSSEATASFVAAMAMAARVYEPHDSAFAATCLDAAERGYAFLVAHPEHLEPDLSEFTTGRYTSDDTDDRLWAAAELWGTSGNAEVLADVEARVVGESVSDDWDWAQLSNLGLFSYALSAREGKNAELQETIAASIAESADRLVTEADTHPFFRALGETYYWGANGLVARSVLNLAAAYQLNPDEKYRRTALRQLDHLFGLNVQGRSFVTGVGYLPPLAPHHRPSGADDVTAPWPGLLVGGPNPQVPGEAAGAVAEPNAAASLQWQDEEGSYWTNEIAINWNAPLVYALAWFYAP